MTRRLMYGTLVLVLIVVNALIVRKELLIRDGRTVLLELAPVDPRSLMQGDYMVLNYRIANEMWQQRPQPDGYLVLKLDEHGVGRLARVHDGGELASGEQLLRYRMRGWRARLGAEAFFFQEGHARHYERAAYGELKVSPAGDSVLIGLRNRSREPMGPERS